MAREQYRQAPGQQRSSRPHSPAEYSQSSRMDRNPDQSWRQPPASWTSPSNPEAYTLNNQAPTHYPQDMFNLAGAPPFAPTAMWNTWDPLNSSFPPQPFAHTSPQPWYGAPESMMHNNNTTAAAAPAMDYSSTDNTNSTNNKPGKSKGRKSKSKNKDKSGVRKSHPNNNNTNNNRTASTKPHTQPPPDPSSDLVRDTISPPSAASGGIPNPSPSYLLRASFLALPSPTPRPMLVVIDLNGTLLFRPSRRQPTKFLARPHAHTFLSYCLETFHVVIWSSARPDNVRNMLAALLPSPEQRNRVIAAWGRDKFGLSAEDYNLRTQCYKRLTRLWTDPIVAAAHPDGEPWNQGNTVLIDDSAEKARSEPFNAITIPEFLGDVNEEPEVLPLVHDYLNTLAMQVDISTYIRTKPFKVDEAAGLAVANADADADATGASVGDGAAV